MQTIKPVCAHHLRKSGQTWPSVARRYRRVEGDGTAAPVQTHLAGKRGN